MHDAAWAAADDKEITVRLACYCARNSIALGRMEYDEEQTAVTYHSDKPTGPTAGSETTDALELACPRCGEEMRIVAFITEPKTIDRILEHLRRRTQNARRRQRAPPRRWKSAASTASA